MHNGSEEWGSDTWAIAETQALAPGEAVPLHRLYAAEARARRDRVLLVLLTGFALLGAAMS